MTAKNKILLIFLSMIIPFGISAATTNSVPAGSLNIKMEPQYPGILTDTRIKLTSFEINLNNAKISWYLNNKLEISGIGKNLFDFRTKEAGTVSTVRVTVEGDNRQLERTISVNPADLDIIWGADTYTPPLYQGKALATLNSSIKLSAIPKFVSEKGILLNADDLTYEWKLNGTRISAGKGLKTTKIRTGGPLSRTEVSLTVKNEDGGITARKSVVIDQTAPEIIFYEEKALEGTNYGAAVQNEQTFDAREISLRVEPYFFSLPKSSGETNLQMIWTMNDNLFLPNEKTPQIVVLRNDSNQNILTKLGLDISNTEYPSQTANLNLLIRSQITF